MPRTSDAMMVKGETPVPDAAPEVVDDVKDVSSGVNLQDEAVDARSVASADDLKPPRLAFFASDITSKGSGGQYVQGGPPSKQNAKNLPPPEQAIDRVQDGQLDAQGNGLDPALWDVMPLPVLSRNRRAVVPSVPGAHAQPAVAPYNSNDTNHNNDDNNNNQEIGNSNNTSEAGSTAGGMQPTPHEDLDGLAVAQMVQEGANPDGMQQANGYDVEAAENRVIKTKEIKKNISMGVCWLLLLVVLATVLGLVFSKSNQQAETEPQIEVISAVPSPSPSEAPTSYISYLLPELDELALEDLLSPKTRALDWLLADIDSSPLDLSEDRLRQRYAMALLYYGTGGDDWEANTNWLNHSVSECSWFQLPDFALRETFSGLFPGHLRDFHQETPPTCNEDGIIEHIWLDRIGQSGILPEEFYTMFPSLKTFSMNDFGGELSTRLGLLTKLEGLALGFLPEAGQMPSEIGLLTELKVFIQHNIHLTGTLPSEFWGLTNLEYVTLSGEPMLRGSIPPEISLISNLKWFNIDGNGIGGSIPTEMGLLSKLEFCTMSNNEFTGTIPSSLGQLTAATLLSMFGNHLESTIPTELGLLSLLRVIGLRDNDLTGSIPSQFGRLTDIHISLQLRNNSLSGPIPSELGLLTKLTELEVRNNRLTGNIPSELGMLQTMGKLTLSDNLLSGPIPQEFQGLQETLYKFSLEGNPSLTGTFPNELCNLKGTCVATGLDWCEPDDGLSFDCNVTCGCDCPSCS